MILYQKKCTTCHGSKGEKKALNKSKSIRTMSKEDFIATLKGYKAKTYGGALKNLMYPQVVPLSDEQISALADFYIK
jgi:cytochrome c